MRFRPTPACIALALVGLACPLGERDATAQPGAPAAETPAAQAPLALALADDGTLTATGELPAGLSPEALAGALPGIDLSQADRSGTGDGAGAPIEWQPALDALSIVLPRFRTAAVQMAAGALAIRGELRSGLSAAGAEAALRAALGTGWRLDLELAETAPAAEIVLTRTGGTTVVSGLLPAGLAPAEAIERLGQGAGDAGLAGGGAGAAEAWARVLAALGASLDLFASASVRVSADHVAIEGVLRPGYPPETVGQRLAARLPQGWTADLAATETPANEGDRRVSLDSGQPETFRRGYWLPDVDFPVSVARCHSEANAVLGAEAVPFAAGTARIDEAGLPLLDRLAAIAVRCLNSSSLRLEIGGHTDSVGNDARNEALSLARAQAVRQALLERGVRADALAAQGYGESRPVASNNTPNGRSANSRISFDWSEPAS
jgi:OOP family OmpA-OmpF porin